MLEYTAAEDRAFDPRLLRWDILGSLGHLEALAAAGLVSRDQHHRLRRSLRAALSAAARGQLVVGADSEDVHTAVERWVTAQAPGAGERLHTGRSRNDQIACDLRLYLKDALLALHGDAARLADELLRLAGRHRRTLWPGYTHTRRAMPSSVGLWAAAHAEGLLDSLEALPVLWRRVDRSPLGSAAGYGSPLPLRREVAARALGFAALEHNVGAVQLGRGKLEAAVLYWCVELARDVSKLCGDIVLFSADEYGYLRIPAALTTGSSIMPHKRNPDVFELTRARAAMLHGELAAALQIDAKLPSGYHRDFQALKEPLLRGLDRTTAMVQMMVLAVPRLEVDRDRCRAAVSGEVLATDEVMRRVAAGEAFRDAYRTVARELRRELPQGAPRPGTLLAAR
jgi:argininosuccinate lyase